LNTASLPSYSPSEDALPEIEQERCTGCGWCATACHCHAIIMGATCPSIDPARCGCSANCPPDCPSVGLCEEVCPTQAIHCSFEITDQEG